MDIDTFGSIYYWVRVAVLGLVTLIAVAAAGRASRGGSPAPDRAIMRTVLPAGALAAAWLLTDIEPDAGLVVGLLVVGLVGGFAASRTRGGRSALGPWLTAFGSIFVVMSTFFGTKDLAALALAFFGLGVGALVGQAVASLAGTERVPEPPESAAPLDG